MIVFADLLDQIKDGDNAMENVMPEIMQTPLIEAQVIDMNIAQMDAGKDNEGKDIVPPYAQYTVDVKKGKGQQADWVTLKDTGDFHSSVFVKHSSTEDELSANDEKTKDLVAKYGDEIFGLTDDNIELLREEIFPYLEEEARKKFL